MNQARQESLPPEGVTLLEKILSIEPSKKMRDRRSDLRRTVGTGALLLAVGAGITELAFEAADHQAQNVQQVSEDARYNQLTHQNSQELPPTITVEKP